MASGLLGSKRSTDRTVRRTQIQESDSGTPHGKGGGGWGSSLIFAQEKRGGNKTKRQSSPPKHLLKVLIFQNGSKSTLRHTTPAGERRGFLYKNNSTAPSTSAILHKSRGNQGEMRGEGQPYAGRSPAGFPPTCPGKAAPSLPPTSAFPPPAPLPCPPPPAPKTHNSLMSTILRSLQRPARQKAPTPLFFLVLPPPGPLTPFPPSLQHRLAQSGPSRRHFRPHSFVRPAAGAQGPGHVGEEPLPDFD